MAGAASSGIRAATGWPDGVALDWRETLDSTSSEGLRRAAAGERGPVWIAAREQSAGRGRRDRFWRSGRDDLTASLLFDPRRYRPGASLGEIACLGLVANLALAEALESLGPTPALTLKWPNDLLAEERKIAGVLVETAGAATVIGVGLNLRTHPPAEALEADAWPAAALSQMIDAPPRPDAALAALAARLEERLVLWGGGGFPANRRDWLARAARLGQTLRLRVGAKRLDGVFADLDATGALALDTADGRHVIHAADVFFPGAAQE